MGVLEEIVKDSSPYPLVDLSEPSIPRPGLMHATPRFCEKVFPKGKCSAFYRSLVALSGGKRQCPYGFTAWSAAIGTHKLAVTALVGAPRFGGDEERMRAKESPDNRVATDAVEAWIGRVSKIVREGASSREDEFARKLDALHEIRKFNSIVKTSMERACDAASPSDPWRAPPKLHHLI